MISLCTIMTVTYPTQLLAPGNDNNELNQLRSTVARYDVSPRAV